MDVGRNEPCPCGSGKKYKKCCLLHIQPVATSTLSEKKFITRLMPEVDDEVNAALDQMAYGNLGQGKREVERLFNKYPDYHVTNYGMGVVIAHFEKRPVEAIPYFENAVESYPIFGSAHFNLGNCYLKAAEIEKAINAYRAARKYGEDEDIRGRAREQLSFIEKTVRTPLISTLDDYLQNASLFNQAFDALQAHRFEEAIFLFKKVLEKEPCCVQAFGNMALAHGFLGQRALAMECFEKALTLDPNYEPAIVNKLMMSEMEEGKPVTPNRIHETQYYAKYSGENKGSYIQDVLKNFKKTSSREEQLRGP